MTNPPYNGEVPTPTFVKSEKAEEKTPTKQTAIPCTQMLNQPQNDKPAEDECKWELHWPICTKSTQNPKAGSSKDWNGKEGDNLQRNYYPQSPWYSPSYDIPDRFSQQYKSEKEWNERMEHLNDKYNLDYYSSSESEFEYESEHKYKTLI